MATTKQQFLDVLRKRLAIEPHQNIPHPLREFDAIPEIGYPDPLDDRPAAYARAASKLNVNVRLIATQADGEELIADVVKASGAASAVLSRDPETQGVADVLRGLGVSVVDFDSYHSAAKADLGITGATYGIAATGTLVLDPVRAGGRSASLLPPTYLALLAASRILPTSGDLFRHMDERFPDGMPSQLVLATGPSSTGDIELVHTVGVHAPGVVWVGILLGA